MADRVPGYVIEAMIEFGRGLGDDHRLDDGGLEAAANLVTGTLVSGMERRGYAWEGRFRSFMLRSIRKIGEEAGTRAEGQIVTADNIFDAFAAIRGHIWRVLRRLDISPRGFSICEPVFHPLLSDQMSEFIRGFDYDQIDLTEVDIDP